MTISKCTAKNRDSRPCANQSTINSLFAERGQLFFVVSLLNPLINPSQTLQYITTYLEDNNFIIFDQNTSELAGIDISSYNIQTDKGVLFFSDYFEESGLIVNNPLRAMAKDQAFDNYLTLYFQSSSERISYFRSFYKLDGLISYMGGLIGSVIGVLFFMGVFTEVAY